MARAKAAPVAEQVTAAVTLEGNDADAVETPMPASVLAEIEAGKAALAKYAESTSAE
jgi:hypothetical protein